MQPFCPKVNTIQRHQVIQLKVGPQKIILIRFIFLYRFICYMKIIRCGRKWQVAGGYRFNYYLLGI